MSYISLSIFAYVPWIAKAEGTLYNNEQNPIHWTVHKYDNPDYIKCYNEKVTIVKPIITMKYNNEFYLYIFDFRLNGINTESIVYKMMINFRKITEINGIEHKEYDWIIFLTDEKISNYDYSNENILDNNNNIIESDDAGGEIHYSKL